MKSGVFVGGIIGLGLTAWLLTNYGFGRIFTLLLAVGWMGMLSMVSFHFIQIGFSALGWRAIAASKPPRMRLSAYAVLRFIREAVNNLLPVAQVGGELVAARLLSRRGWSLSAAIAGTAADLSIEITTHIVFTLIGLLWWLQRTGSFASALYIAGAVIMALVLAACSFFLALRSGVVKRVEKWLIMIGTSLGWAGATGIDGLEERLRDCYRSPRGVLLSAIWHMVSWLLGAVEVCIGLHFLGLDVDLSTGLIVESAGQALKAAGFAVPGALGVQEGGYVIICRVMGIAPDAALALSLLKRLREIALGLPGLVVWQLSERKSRHGAAPLSEGIS